MTEEICRKLATELKRGITTEPQVVYLMAGIRKLIERDGLGEEYQELKFHCDWVLHSKLEGPDARRILHLFDKAEGMKRTNINYDDLPSGLRRDIDRISKMDAFRSELCSFLERYEMPSLRFGEHDAWTYFLHLYLLVIQDIPLMVGSPRRRVQREPIPPPIHISHISARCQLAIKPLQYGGEREMLYRIWWTLHMVDGEPQPFFIENSFTMLPDDSERAPSE